MPAPAAGALKGLFTSNFAGTLGGEGEIFVETLASAVANGWSAWQGGLSWGGVTVTGAGIGAWASTLAIGGAVAESGGFKLPVIPDESVSPEMQQFVAAFREVLEPAYTGWVSSYAFSGILYIGTCTATPVAPGQVNAIITPPVPLASAGTGSNPSGIANLWAAKLKKPEFDINNPQAKTKDMIDGFAAMIEKGFSDLWLSSALASLNTLASGPTDATAAVGAFVGDSENDGTIV